MQIGYIGLGKMGMAMVAHLLEQGHTVIAHNKSPEAVDEAVKLGALGAKTIDELAKKLTHPYVIWLMVPHTAVEKVLTLLEPHLEPGDVIIDGGNSYYKTSQKRAEKFTKQHVAFLDVGVCGGPASARHGAAITVGGQRDAFDVLETLFSDISAKNGCMYAGKSGAGHFVKMVHNGIEYGMLQALAEGFDILKHSDFALSPSKIATPYKSGSIIASSLLTWLSDAYQKYGDDLDGVSGSAEASGEADWTIQAAKDLGIPAKVIGASLRARITSQEKPSYQGKIVTAVRGEFGGHPIADTN